ncbi:hypothetical protein RHMOL_Rhmol04G0272500 [Rhododendron molle]|uniref:Uncharacterized protein n=1 Tax=Rhododendron molle TaxID=49168 RepID=A0ACC0P5Y6_RHOML|nr:hypothetical protein RHMOL_Rhmol04G0272500 [Rhododendron molle]
MMARSKGQARKSLVPLINVNVKKVAIVHEEISPQKSQLKPSGFALSVLKIVIREGKTDERFQRAYMLYALGCLLCPITKEVARNRLFSGVVDNNIEGLKAYTWLFFVLDWLINEIRNYKIRASKGRGRSAEGVGGSLFVLKVIYFDLNPLNVKIGKEPQPPIALWTKKLMDIRIIKEMEDKPVEDSIFSQFSSHNLRNQRFIDMYKDLVRQFVSNAKSLHDIDAAMIEPVGGSPEHGLLPRMLPSISPEDGQDGPWQKNVQNEGHLPTFTENCEMHQIEEEKGEVGDKSKFKDGQDSPWQQNVQNVGHLPPLLKISKWIRLRRRANQKS